MLLKLLGHAMHSLLIRLQVAQQDIPVQCFVYFHKCAGLTPPHGVKAVIAASNTGGRDQSVSWTSLRPHVVVHTLRRNML